MTPEIINTAAQQAQQVGLLTYLVVAITLFCGFIVIFVMVTNNKREERYAKLVERDIVELGHKVDGCSMTIKESMSVLAEAARYQKEEHKSMIESLTKTSETLIALAAVIKLPHNL